MTLTSGKITATATGGRMLPKVQGVHESAGWKIKIYQNGENKALFRFEESLSRAFALASIGCDESRYPVGFCVVTKADVSITEVVLGLWVVSGSVHLMQFNLQLGAMVSPKNDLSLQCAEIIAYETKAIKAALETRSSEEEVERQYLSDWFLADPDQPSHTAMRATLEHFTNAWRRGDIDGLMKNMAAFPSYRTSSGAGFEGREEVRRGLSEICRPSPETPTADDESKEIFFFANRSLSYWSLALPTADGTVRDVKGVDVITYDADGRILLKDAYRKLS